MSIVVFGSINADIVVTASRLPKTGETLRATGLASYPGGKGANQAVAAARLGASVALVGRVGSDQAAIVEALKRSGVDTRAVSTDTTVTTGTALITVGANGENTIVTVGGANHRVGTDELRALDGQLVDAEVLLIQLELPIDIVAAAVTRADARGVTVVLDPAPVTEIPADLYSKIDWITPNETEAEALCGRVSPEAAAADLRSRGVRHVVLKLGPRGCFYSGPDGKFAVPAPEVEVIDTVACGDAFNGALAARLIAGDDVATALRWACAAGSAAATTAGAYPSLNRLTTEIL